MFFAFLKLIGLTLMGELLRPKPEFEHARPAGFGDVTFPTAEVGRAIPVIFGRVRQRGANLLWYGDYATLPITSAHKVKGLFKSKTYHQVTGHRYFVGLHLGLGAAGVETLHRVWAEERTAWQGTQAFPGSIYINAPYLWGGIDEGGGLVGTLELLPGGVSQAVPTYLNTHQSSPPAYRGISSVILHRGEVGTSPQIRPPSFELSRYPDTLGHGAIGQDLNPAEILWETLTDSLWGLGASASLLDQTSFADAGTVLDGEGLGLSLTWDSRRSIGDFCGEILRHVDGVIFPSLREAKLKMALARGGYDVGTLQVLDSSNVLEVKNYSRTAWQETVNELRTLFTSRASGYVNDTATAFDLANYDLQGCVSVSRQVQYPGVNDPTRANELAWRDLRALSTPLARGTLVVNRQAHRLEPGDVFVWTWAPLDVEQLVMRITKVRPGAPGTSRIELDVVQDVFSLAASSFGDPPATAWTDPVSDPEAVTLQELGEVPYIYLFRDDGSIVKGTVDPDLAHVHVVAARPNSSTFQATIETRVGSDEYVARETLSQFTPTATLVDDYPEDTDPIDTTVEVLIEDLEDEELLEDADADLVAGQLRNLALLNDELIAWQSITDNGDGTWTLSGVWRGQVDTVPAGHSAGTRIWFISEGQASTPDTYALATSVDMRLIPTTTRGELDSGDATPLSHTITRRSLRPYPPGDIEVNGEAWPEVIEGELAITWAHRDRTQQEDLIAQDAASVGPEAGVTYTLRIYGETDSLLRTETGLTGTSYTYQQADEESDAGRLQGRLRFELESVRSGYASHQFQGRTVRRAGYGLQYGRYYGGAPP